MEKNMTRPEIYVISLADCVDRRLGCKSQLETLGENIKWQFVDAVDGRGRKDYPPCYDRKHASQIVGFTMTQGEVACFMSHQKVWRIAVETQKAVVVLEDDFYIQAHFLASIDLAMEESSNWDIFRLQGLLEVEHKTLFERDGMAVVQNLVDPLGSAGYVIQPQCAAELLKWSEKIYEPVDHYLEHVRYHKQRLVCIHPYSVKTDDVPSTIDDRPKERVIVGWKKKKRSLHRLWFRMYLKGKGRTW